MLLGIKVNLHEIKVDLYGLPHGSVKCKYIKCPCVNAIQFCVKFCQVLNCPELTCLELVVFSVVALIKKPRYLNPLHLKISMHILYTVFYTFPKVLTRRFCLIIKSSYTC